jgi:hypothetical protein
MYAGSVVTSSSRVLVNPRVVPPHARDEHCVTRFDLRNLTGVERCAKAWKFWKSDLKSTRLIAWPQASASGPG